MQRALAEQTAAAVRNNEELLVLGGDHSCAIGTWSGVAVALRPVGDVGLIWVDAHMVRSWNCYTNRRIRVGSEIFVSEKVK